MRNAGADVCYRQCDLVDAEAFGQLIDDAYASYGRLDGVIHGAGVIEDRLVEHKAPASFDRVFAAKVTGALVLAQKLRPESLKFLALFSSVAGRFGNRGQADYAAANEVLNKLAAHLDARWPGRVVAINWGPWDGSNMVNDAVREQFVRRDVQLIDPSVGCAAFIAELLAGRKGEPEVILGGGPWGRGNEAATPAHPGPELASPSLPMLDATQMVPAAGGAVQLILTLDSSRHLFLNDHRIDGKSVLPAAMAIEIMAEAVQRAWPDWVVTGVTSLRVCKGVVLGDIPEALCVSARAQTHHDPERPELDVNVEIKDPNHPRVVYYRGTVCLGDRLREAPRLAPTNLGELRPFPLSTAEAYRRRLFHGSRFHCLERIDGMSEAGILAAVRPSRPGTCLAVAEAGPWIIDPVLLDAGPQLAILWAQESRGMTALPSRFGNVQLFDGFPAALVAGAAEPLECRFVVALGADETTVLADFLVFGPDGRLVLSVRGLESTCSQALNRLAVAAESFCS
jgi:NAD(P)-dependent dehydrogenase (short-subunit alcohol dehydrogenase family)